MDAVKVYGEKSKERKRLEAAAALINAEITEGVAVVGETFWDYGGGVRWTTIIMVDEDQKLGDYQALNPSRQGKIVFGTLQELTQAVMDVIENHATMLRLKDQLRGRSAGDGYDKKFE